MRKNSRHHKPRTGKRGIQSVRRHTVIPTLLRWYRNHGRALPWRETADPYRILVSEVMLQQTQVHRVLPRYSNFLQHFPTIQSLAKAGQRDVVIAWQGMGYNNRAVRLHRLAGIVVNQLNGRIPRTAEQLMELPGIGRYTANAVLAAAYGMDVPVVDVNVRRVLSRVWWKMHSTADTQVDSTVWQLASRLVPRHHGNEWTQALMDLGAMICTPRRPRCVACPLERHCASRRTIADVAAPRSRHEPSLGGVPNRIYRGRIVEELRREKGKRKIRFEVLGRKIYPRFARSHTAWLDSLLRSLHRDGLIRIDGNGSVTTRYVSLV